MEPFEYDGIFWTADEPDRRVAGRLSYTPAEGSTLNLTGAFITDLQVAFQDTSMTPVRINGVAEGRYLTLENCLLRNTTISSIDMPTAQYLVTHVLSGVHFESGEEISFDELWIKFDQLTYWIDRQPFIISVETANPNDFSTETSTSITYRVQDTETFQARDAAVKLDFMRTIKGDQITEMTIGHQAQLRIHYSERRSLANIILDINGLQDLVTLAVDAPTVPTEVILLSSDITREGQSATPIPVPIDLFSPNAAEHVRREKPQFSNDMFFRFDQIGGIETAGKWISVSRKYRIVLGYLLTLRYSARLYGENRFSNVISAAETYHRMRFPNETRPKLEFRSYRRKLVKAVKKYVGSQAASWVGDQLLYSNEPRLRDRLYELADHAGPEFAALVGDSEAWAGVVTMTRNRLTHHDDNQPFERGPSDLHFLTESLYVLVLICIFKECEVPEDALTNIRGSQRIQLLQRQFEEIIPRLSSFLARRVKVKDVRNDQSDVSAPSEKE